MKGLYIHIPFCEYICHYCDFVKQVPKNDEMIDKYLDNLILEIASYKAHFSTIDTIYIGGGTPSMLKTYQLEKLFKSLHEITPLEMTIEVNPESYSLEKGFLFKQYGINRISLGVQSFNDKILAYINRKHTKDTVTYAVNSLRSLGINNISIDLIYAIPGQTTEILKNDLQEIARLNIQHISCYSLILEDKTYFYHQFLKGEFRPVENDLEAEMFEIVKTELKKQGFIHYEISNFAKGNHQSLHNTLYWTLNEYIGVGLGAHGFINNVRTYNNKSLNKYYEKWQSLSIPQTENDNLTDYLIFGLRLIDGININECEKRFKIKLLDKYPELLEKHAEGLITFDNNRLRLTEKGLMLGNQVFEVFI